MILASYCPVCAHDYRRDPQGFTGACPYCGAGYAPVREKTFYEVSKSAIEKWGLPGDKFGCPARWFFKYVEHRPEPKSPELQFGIDAHALGEAWMRDRKMPQVDSLMPARSNANRAALSLLGGIPHMPPPETPGLLVESEFHYEFEGVHFGGYRDVWAPLTPTNAKHGPVVPNDLRFAGLVGSDTLRDGGIRGGASVIGDWKFVSRRSFDDFTPTPEKLATDLQATIESFDDIRRGATDVHLNWVYMPRGERLGKPVRALVHPDTIVPRLRTIAETAQQMGAAMAESKRRPLDQREFATNANACNSYNRPCPFLSVCHVSQTDKIGALIMQGFPGTAPTNGLDGLVASFTPPPAAAPAWAPPAAPQIDPKGLYSVMSGGQRYDGIPGTQIPAALASGATLIDVPAPAQPPPAVVNPGAAVNPPPAPMTAPATAPAKTTKTKAVKPEAAPIEAIAPNDETLTAINGLLAALRIPVRVVPA